jgi:hypothetical protein
MLPLSAIRTPAGLTALGVALLVSALNGMPVPVVLAPETAAPPR